jgi:hypothetical protein
MTLEFIKRNKDSLYQNVTITLGPVSSHTEPSTKSVKAIMMLVEKVEKLEEEIKELKNGKINTEVGPL